MNRVPNLLMLILMLGTSACGTPVREEVFEYDGPTTSQIWHGQLPRSETLGDQYGRWPGTPVANGWFRGPHNETEALFPSLPNPRIDLFIFPHLTADGYPVPGYATSFHLYGHSQVFALPSEAFQLGIWR